jgi:hypothetical protein
MPFRLVRLAFIDDDPNAVNTARSRVIRDASRRARAMRVNLREEDDHDGNTKQVPGRT